MARMEVLQTDDRVEADMLLEKNPDKIVIWESVGHGRTFVFLHPTKDELAKKMAKKLGTLMVNSMPEGWNAIVLDGGAEKVIVRLRRLGYVK